MNGTTKRNTFLRGFRQSVLVTLVLLLICGLLFPVVLSLLSSVLFSSQSAGSLVMADGKAVGATFVGQDFTEPYFMKGRPSAYHYNTYYEDENGNQFYNDGSEFGGLASGSNNYGPSNPALQERVEQDMQAVMDANPGVEKQDIPADLVTASGSGLDPHISPESARLQIPALAEASGLGEEALEKIVEDNTTHKLLGIFGEEAVNVLGVNVDIARSMGLISSAEK